MSKSTTSKQPNNPNCAAGGDCGATICYPKEGIEFVGFGHIGVVDKVLESMVHYYMRPMGKGSMSLAAWKNVSIRKKG